MPDVDTPTSSLLQLGAQAMDISRLLERPTLVIAFVAAVAFLSPSKTRAEDSENLDQTVADPMVGNKAGQVRNDNGPKMKFVWCSPGSFEMESFERRAVAIVEKVPQSEDDIEDQRVVQTEDVETFTPVKAFLTRGYWIGRYEVTQAEWKHVMEV